MYKVFIDHTPIIFVQKNDLSTENSTVEAGKGAVDSPLTLNSRSLGSLEEVKELLKDASIENPLYLTSDNPSKEFKRLFADYKYIEAAGGIVKRKESYLIIKRKGFWDIPKGMIDENETPEVACVREIMEECGINGHEIVSPLVNTFHTMKWDGKNALKKTFWFILNYNGPSDVFPQEEEDITEVKWMTRDEMLSIRSNTFGSINEVLDAFEN